MGGGDLSGQPDINGGEVGIGGGGGEGVACERTG